MLIVTTMKTDYLHPPLPFLPPFPPHFFPFIAYTPPFCFPLSRTYHATTTVKHTMPITSTNIPPIFILVRSHLESSRSTGTGTSTEST